MSSKIDRLLIQLMNLHPKYIDLSLKRLGVLLKKLENPHYNLPKTVHIAGTNGKGSTLSYLRKILTLNGYSCHAYISPHLNKFNERIIINNREISSKKLYDTLKYVKKINNGNPITFFEITTAAAFVLFAKKKADFLILETGLGGRLDATNIIPNKLLSIITNISMDHEEFLGKTIKKITKEKLGITKYSKKILISKQSSDVEKIIKLSLKNKKNVYYYDKDYNFKNKSKSKFIFQFNNRNYLIKKPQLLGDHQLENAASALAGAFIIKSLGFKIKCNLFNSSIYKTKWPGRLEMINYKNKIIIFDGSHNISGSEKLNIFLKQKKIKPIVLFGMLNNKKMFHFLKTIKDSIEKIIAIKIPNEKNSFTPSEIEKNCKKLLISCQKKTNIIEAKKFISKTKTKYILITGSLYLVGKLRKKYL